MKKIEYILISTVCVVMLGFCFLLTMSFGRSFAAPLSSGDKVKGNSDLTYYLNVDYDGVDENSIESDETTTANVRSGYIEVEDKLPDGMEFQKIVDPGNGQIGAVKKGDGDTCSGYVVGGVKGVEYHKDTHTVSFKVLNLGAGCRLTVGVVVKTPKDDGTRRDFYNYFQGTENDLTDFSNQVHVYMGAEDEPLFDVEYQYDGKIPENAPELPDDSRYAKNTNVVVANDVNLSGYKFSGWDSQDVVVNNGSFKMPERKVTLVGSFEEKQSYKVTYQIKGDSPKNYVVPSPESYYENTTVTIDSLQKDEVVDGYRFLGWTTDDDVVVEEGVFQMPADNVTITGRFERISYEVKYEFIGAVIPKEGANLLPATKRYYPGDKVTLVNPAKAEGYKFLGWYKKDEFVMPEEDVVIQGEWGVAAGLFEVKIQKEIINYKDSYKLGDVVKFKTDITNPNDFELKNVMVRENHNQAKFVEGSDYEVSSDHIATISSIAPGKTVTLYSEYEVTNNSLKKEVNEVEIVGVSADNGYVLDDSKEYISSVSFETSKNIIGIPNTELNGNYVVEILAGILILCGIGGVIFAIKASRKKEKQKR